MKLLRWTKELFRIVKAALRAVFVEDRPLEFVSALIRDYRIQRSSCRLSLYVTSICSLDCEECIMQFLMKADPKYQMSLEELDKFISMSEYSNYSFDFLLTGGEPLIWKNLREGLKRLRQSRICNSIRILSNAMNIDRLDDEIMGYLDGLRVSEYSTNKENIPDSAEKMAGQDIFRKPRRILGESKTSVSGTLPAVCLNPEMLLYKDQVFACPHSRSIALSVQSELRLANPVAPHFMTGLFWIKAAQQAEICTRCISNQRVRDKAKKTNNIVRPERAA
ncbi:MAG: 4Fe-4S cluster-binding domain-containing protein [Bdellovibrionota bacterium]